MSRRAILPGHRTAWGQAAARSMWQSPSCQPAPRDQAGAAREGAGLSQPRQFGQPVGNARPCQPSPWRLRTSAGLPCLPANLHKMFSSPLLLLQVTKRRQGEPLCLGGGQPVFWWPLTRRRAAASAASCRCQQAPRAPRPPGCLSWSRGLKPQGLSTHHLVIDLFGS